MKLSDYLKDADVVVRLKGAVVTPEQLEASGVPLSLNMYDALAVKTAAGLLTVTSVSGRKAQTVAASVSPIVARQLDDVVGKTGYTGKSADFRADIRRRR